MLPLRGRRTASLILPGGQHPPPCASICVAIDDLTAMLKAHGDLACRRWAPSDKQKPAGRGSRGSLGCALQQNPVVGLVRPQDGRCAGRFGMYLPPRLDTLGLWGAGRHTPKNNPRCGAHGSASTERLATKFRVRAQPSGKMPPETI